MQCVKDRVDLKAELKLDDKPHPEERWEGRFTFSDEDSANELFLRARLRFAAGLVEGQGVLSFKGENILDVAVTGETTGSDVAFTAWVNGGGTIEGQLTCRAELLNDGNNLVGTFTHGCINPVECSAECKGGWGDFDLVKVVE